MLTARFAALRDEIPGTSISCMSASIADSWEDKVRKAEKRERTAEYSGLSLGALQGAEAGGDALRRAATSVFSKKTWG
jgi:hypothetical protein